MKQVDYLIIGLGLAGAMLSKELLRRGQSVRVIDAAHTNAASRVAIGLVNPITGKRLVKSWLIDELIPKAKAIYHQLECELGEQVLHNCQIARIIPNDDIFEQWQPNFQQAIEEGYISKRTHQIKFGNQTHHYFLIQNAFWVNTKKVVEHMQQFWLDKGLLTKQHFDYSLLALNDSGIVYDGIKAKNVIFCEGWQGSQNPFFKHLPFNLNKGEVVKANMQDYDFQHVLKKNIFVIQQQDEFRIGATYDRENINLTTSETATAYFQKKLKEIGLDASLYEQQASIRPATVDRRPFIGQHHTHQQVFIFNGFGAKGVSLIPYFAEQFVDELLGGKEVIREASTRRFYQ